MITLTEEEVIILYDFLKHQWITYEKPELIRLMRKILDAKLYIDENELANRDIGTTC